MREFRRRNNTRPQASNYCGKNCYFVTLCWFRPEANLVRRAKVSLAPGPFASGKRQKFLPHPAYCLMPDHLHFLSEGAHPMSDLLHFVKCLKVKSSRLYTARAGQTLWQKEFYEHILRPGDSGESVAWHIGLNPVRRGIVERPEQFAGSRCF